MKRRSAQRVIFAGQRGDIATQAAFVLPVLLAFTAIAVDTAYLYVEETHLQSVTDATALAAASAYQTRLLADVEALRLESIAENAHISGGPYDASGFALRLGTWTPGTGFVPVNVTSEDDFVALADGENAAVEVIASGQMSPLFFGTLLTGSYYTGVAARSVVAARALGLGPPQNCGVLSDSNLEIGGGTHVDGYSSGDCGGGGYVDPPDSDMHVGVCSNGDVFHHGSSEVWGSISWGADPADEMKLGGVVPMVTPQQLAQHVNLPTIESCEEGGARDGASDTFWADVENWRDCIDADGDGDADTLTAKEAAAAITVKYDAASKDYDVKVASDQGLVITQGCGAPRELCVHDLTTTAKGTMFVDPDSYASGDPIQILASGDVTITGQGLVNLDDSATKSGSTWESSGEGAGGLEIHAQGDVDLAGGSAFSGVVFAEGDLDYTGNADLWGDFFARGEVRFAGTAQVHLDRCYELNQGDGPIDTVANRLVLVE